jgi:HlyD family secretion protein
MSTSRHSVYPSLNRHILIGFLTVAALVGGIGAWAASTEIYGAVIASGFLVVESSVKKVQHPTGGVVGELFVRDGDHVKAGEVIMRLDATQTKANLGIVVKTIDELTARGSRLEAEKIGADTIDYPAELLTRKDDDTVAKLLEGESKLFELRRDAREGEKAQLNERIAQLREEITGLEEQTGAKKEEIVLVNKELEAVRGLWDKNLVQINRIMALEREAVRLDGESGTLVAAIAQAKGRIAEVKLQIIQVDQNMRSEVAQELSEGRVRLAELSERKVAAEDHLKRIDIRAPQNGIVHQQTVHTVGGVVSPGEPIMLVVPEADKLVVEARVSPIDIDQIQVGQKAALMFSAFNTMTTPEVAGKVSRVGADLSQDPHSGAQYYIVRVAIDETEIANLKGLKLVPGMPVEAFIQTGKRSVLSYVIKPLEDQVARTFKEG